MNDTDIRNAVNALIFFRNSFCLDVKETEQKNEPVFRCNKCSFRNKDNKCDVKQFLSKYATDEEIQRSQVMLR